MSDDSKSCGSPGAVGSQSGPRSAGRRLPSSASPLGRSMLENNLVDVVCDAENPPKSKTEAMIRAGYARTTAEKNQTVVFSRIASRLEAERAKRMSLFERVSRGHEAALRRVIEMGESSPDPVTTTGIASHLLKTMQTLREMGASDNEVTKQDHQALYDVLRAVAEGAYELGERGDRAALDEFLGEAIEKAVSV